MKPVLFALMFAIATPAFAWGHMSNATRATHLKTNTKAHYSGHTRVR
jgi:hypothetical protein